MEAKRRKWDKDDKLKDKLETRALELGKRIQFPVADQINHTPKQEMIKKLFESYISMFPEVSSKEMCKFGHKILDMIEFYENEVEKEKKLRMDTELARQTLADKLFDSTKENTKIRNENTQLLDISQRDYLTGAFNRSKFESQLKTLIKIANRTGDELSLIEFDLDKFKPINDKHGHQAGDLVLKYITKKIDDYMENNLRESDIFVRFGGDEFAIILYQTDEEGAYEVAKRVKDIIDNAKITFNGEDLSVNVTMGVKQYAPEESFEEFFGKTDAVLYLGKESGKDKIVRYSENKNAVDSKYFESTEK